MTYSVYQHWDKLKSCVVGISYPPEFYDYIQDEKTRKIFYRIAEETEEDYQKLISLLQKFNVDVVRPNVNAIIDISNFNISINRPAIRPFFMQPRDYSIMLGKDFFIEFKSNDIWEPIISKVKSAGNEVFDSLSTLLLGQKYRYALNGAMTTRVGKDLYVGTMPSTKHIQTENGPFLNYLKKYDYRVHVVNTQGHADGSFCPVVPGLIFSILDQTHYEITFPNWEVVYLKGESWSKVSDWLELKKQNGGKWYLPYSYLDNNFINYVESWLNDWVGYVEESVFDVNMLVIDKHNVVVNGYNELAWEAFSKHNITPHICNFRHRYFWDGGLHCITSDLDREGSMQDYFPERN